ncbi:unnamed protein product [Mytilus edulis]|uniref:Uncharacterized protein n=1 Tax=Mytilus edulis TaxID=6550 RepID=A0A8S3VE48_MYTED|nr:unnamed protein product [Mytilus edulis]
MTGLIVLKGLLVCTIVLKLIWNFVLNGQESDNAPQTWSGKRRRPDHIRRKYMYSTPARTIMDESDTPYDSDEMPSYSCPIPNSPVINGQRHTEMDISGQESENKSTSTKQIQSPDFIIENISELNTSIWNNEKSQRVLLSTLRGQVETYACGMPVIIQRDHNRLEGKMEERFGHTVMKERHVTEAKLRKRKPEESLRDFGQAIEDLFRRAYPGILRL